LLKRFLLIAAAAFAVVVVIVLLLQRPSTPEPQYQGKTISAWMFACAIEPDTDILLAFTAIGTNGIPYMVEHMELHDSSIRKSYFWIRDKLPLVAQKLVPQPKPLFQEDWGANAFSYMGTNSLPYAAALLKHPSPSVRRFAVAGFRGLGDKAPEVRHYAQALVEALSDAQPDDVRINIMLSLGDMGSAASNAVPHLTRIATSTSTPANILNAREIAIRCLGQIGPIASNGLPVLHSLLKSPEPELRVRSAIAIWRIQGDTNAILPVLKSDFSLASQGQLWEIYVTLGEIGLMATNALPQRRETDTVWILNRISLAIYRIESSTYHSLQSSSAE
jgi:HEAT repeat protein